MNSLEKYIHDNRTAFDLDAPSDQIWENLVASSHVGDCPLELFLTENRDSLDLATPDLKVWANIEQALPRRISSPIFYTTWSRQLLRAAATIALIISCFGAGWWFARHGKSPDTLSMSTVSSEYAELENYYQREIAGKQEKFASFASQQEPVLEDLAQMDNAMKELRRELANVPVGNREQVIHAMIENYKAKAAILEKVLEHIQPQQINSQQSNSAQHEVINI